MTITQLNESQAKQEAQDGAVSKIKEILNVHQHSLQVSVYGNSAASPFLPALSLALARSCPRHHCTPISPCSLSWSNTHSCVMQGMHVCNATTQL